VFRSRESALHTARGVANGLFWGLTPTVGLQTLEILATWFIARRWLRRDSSLLQAMIWVWVNNPLTMLPMYYTFYVTGQLLTGRPATAIGYDTFTRSGVTDLGMPLLVGAVPYATAGAMLGYRWALKVVQRRRERLAARRLRNFSY
jgi:uncharacterized protein (DUF2062 family)